MKIILSAAACLLLLGICSQCWAGTTREGQVTDANKKAHKLIYINAERGIDPREITVPLGTTVIWINNSDSRLHLKFTGQQISLACAAPVNFSLDDNKVFISTGIPLGGVASLCLIEKGEFHYQLIRRDQYGAPSKLERYNGVIRVQ